MIVDDDVMIFDHVEDLYKKQFDEKFSNCILDFYAEWCGQCKSMTKTLQEFAERHPNFPVIKIDAETWDELDEAFEVQHLPTLIFIKDGKEKSRKGFLSLSALEEEYKTIY